MAVTVEIPYSKTILSPKDSKTTYDFFADLETAVGKNFPGLEVFKPLGANQYEWQFKKVEHSGYSIQIGFVTQFQKEPDKSIRMDPVPKPGMSQLKGIWRFEPAGKDTKVHFDATILLELPLPFFLKSVAGPITQKEIIKLFDRYVTHVSQTLSA